MVILLAQAVAEGGQDGQDDQGLIKDTELGIWNGSENFSKMAPGGSLRNLRGGIERMKTAGGHIGHIGHNGHIGHIGQLQIDPVFLSGFKIKELAPLKAR